MRGSPVRCARTADSNAAPLARVSVYDARRFSSPGAAVPRDRERDPPASQVLGDTEVFRMARTARSRLVGRWATRPSAVLFLAAAPLLVAAPGVAAPSGAAPSGAPAAAVESDAYSARYLVQPNPLPSTNGLALDGRGNLYVAQALYDRITRIDLTTGAAERIADDTDPVADALQSPDDVAVGPDGNLYVTNALKKSVVRMAPDGSARTTIASEVTDGVTGPNGIAFASDGRLFVSDLAFDPAHPGGLWQVDPQGAAAPRQLTHRLRVPEGFGMASDGLAYIPEYYAGRIAVVDPGNPGSVAGLSTRFQGLVSAVKVMPKTLDPAESLVLVENLPGQGNVWRVDRASGSKTLLAAGRGAFDNLAIDPGSGTIYVSNFVQGGIQRVNPRTRTLTGVFPTGPLATPTSLSLNPDGSLLVAGATSLASVSPRGRVTTLSQFLISRNQGVTPGAVQIGTTLYYTDWLDSSRPGRLMKLDLRTGTRSVVASGFVIPWHVRQGPAGTVLVSDEALGNVYRVNVADGARTVVATGLNSPAGLAYDAHTQQVYIAEAGAGRVVAVPVQGGTPGTVAGGLDKPEGVTLDGQGRLLVVDAQGSAQQNPAAPGSLLRVVPGTASRTVLATGLPTKITGITLIPGFTFTSDVVARADGTIVVSGAANGSIIELSPNR
ncbi:hypothetical protein ACIRL2_40475 [Embleya sp. NPDC127516]|uniref:hypothetical protein n=1 Tax=Embleya sp. NPDC127516 TaxID=3363990 RepID=UPI003813BDB9